MCIRDRRYSPVRILQRAIRYYIATYAIFIFITGSVWWHWSKVLIYRKKELPASKVEIRRTPASDNTNSSYIPQEEPFLVDSGKLYETVVKSVRRHCTNFVPVLWWTMKLTLITTIVTAADPQSDYLTWVQTRIGTSRQSVHVPDRTATLPSTVLLNEAFKEVHSAVSYTHLTLPTIYSV